MKNLLIPTIMFLSLITFVSFAVTNICDTITDNTVEIEEMIRNRDFKNANMKADEIINLIGEKSVITSIYLNHSDYDCLMEEAVELLIYTECEDYVECLIATNSLNEFAKNLRNLHRPTIENIL